MLVAVAGAALAMALLHLPATRRPAARVAARPTSLLSRPLHLPHLRPGARCPTSGGYGVHNRHFNSVALGNGPVRVLLADRGDCVRDASTSAVRAATG